ncbi:uncharacterized protein CLUP02_00293 [Colletotrichum lupini]|uniref:Uncharacterized protein n=1 Tax=Colletotrichum lupini TaxID=145971 RepID=A0A9Q8SAT3_9PEZI|nr:uncharacterized protein CLUP02_00293 [Colletotrichum lupini]UQC73648.1 hypothetical protein CLUP02_00293 [Colletotrichum lupini]
MTRVRHNWLRPTLPKERMLTTRSGYWQWMRHGWAMAALPRFSSPSLPQPDPSITGTTHLAQGPRDDPYARGPNIVLLFTPATRHYPFNFLQVGSLKALRPPANPRTLDDCSQLMYYLTFDVETASVLAAGCCRKSTLARPRLPRVTGRSQNPNLAKDKVPRIAHHFMPGNIGSQDKCAFLFVRGMPLCYLLHGLRVCANEYFRAPKLRVP